MVQHCYLALHDTAKRKAQKYVRELYKVLVGTNPTTLWGIAVTYTDAALGVISPTLVI